MSIFNRIFRGGREGEDDGDSESSPNEDAPTDVDDVPAELASPPAGSPVQGAPVTPETSESRSYHPALNYTPPAGLVMPNQSPGGTSSEPAAAPPHAPDTEREAPSQAAPARARQPAAPAQSSGRIKTEPMPKPPPPGVKRRLTPLPPGATTRAKRPSRPLRKAAPASNRAATAPSAKPPAVPARSKTQPGSGTLARAAAKPRPAPPRAAKPPAPEAAPAGKSDGKIQAALDGMDTQQLRANLDSAFSDLESGSGNGQGAGSATERDLESVRELFEDMAADYMARVRDFMIEVKWGEATPNWAGRCEPVVRSLRRFADKVGHKQLSDRLRAYGKQLTAARRAGGARIQGEPAKALMAAFDALAELSPSVFELDTERDRREPVIVEALLRQVPVRRVGLDKLHAAGLHQLRAFFAAKPDDVASLADIPVDVAERVVAQFSEYRKSADASLSAADVNAEHRRLKALVAELRREHQAYERAARQWSAEALANKRHYRETRDQSMLKIQVCLARLGRLDEWRAIDKQCYSDKLASLDEYLARALAAGLGRASTSSGGSDEHRP